MGGKPNEVGLGQVAGVDTTGGWLVSVTSVNDTTYIWSPGAPHPIAPRKVAGSTVSSVGTATLVSELEPESHPATRQLTASNTAPVR